MNFPYPCSRCGFCCISENCPASMEYYKIPKKGVLCPALIFNSDDTTSCGLMDRLPTKELKAILGAGVGCCIKATIYTRHGAIDFASVPREVKINIVKNEVETRNLTLNKRSCIML